MTQIFTSLFRLDAWFVKDKRKDLNKCYNAFLCTQLEVLVETLMGFSSSSVSTRPPSAENGDKNRWHLFNIGLIRNRFLIFFSSVCVEGISVISWEKNFIEIRLLQPDGSVATSPFSHSQHHPSSAHSPSLLSFRCHFVWYTGVRAGEERRQRFGLVGHLLYHTFV